MIPGWKASLQEGSATGDSETEDEHGMDEGDEAQLFQSRREGAVKAGDGEDSPARSSEERHKISAQVNPCPHLIMSTPSGAPVMRNALFKAANGTSFNEVSAL